MNARGMCCIHFQSAMNNWMECLIYVSSDYVEVTLEAIRKGVEIFNEESNQEAYGQCIELALAAADIPYLVEYSEYDEETDEPYLSWVAHTEKADGCKALNTRYVEL